MLEKIPDSIVSRISKTNEYEAKFPRNMGGIPLGQHPLETFIFFNASLMPCTFMLFTLISLLNSKEKDIFAITICLGKCGILYLGRRLQNDSKFLASDINSPFQVLYLF